MSKKTVPPPSSPAPAAPIAETKTVLAALERLDRDARLTVLRSAVAFYGIGNQELHAGV